MRKKTEKIDIILPSRIGDCILSLPSLLCLKQVAEKFPEKKLKITIFSTSKLTEIIQKLNLFEVYFGFLKENNQYLNHKRLGKTRNHQIRPQTKNKRRINQP